MKKKWYHIFKVITDSAGLAFILSIAFFAYETWESKRETKEVVDNLVQIQNSLSTRYLGLFPEYISNINVQLEHAMERQNYSPNPQDSIIIFQDVLYYGILSDPEGFRNMNRNLLTLANNGCHVTIAYYGLNSEPFNRMLRDALIDTRYHTAYQQSIKDHRNEVRRLNSELATLHFAPNTPEYKAALLEKVKMYFPDAYHRLADIQSGDNPVRRIMHTLNDRAYIDSLASERYFDSTKVILKEKLLKKRKGYLRGIPLDKHATDSITLRVNQMCKQLDDVKKKYLDKNFKNLRFADYQNMYVEMSQTIIDLYSLSSNIEIIPLSETLLMSCWLTKVGGQEHAIFAFPSKYSTDEIGFISQDKAISDYIHKMLSGIQNGMLHSDRHH